VLSLLFVLGLLFGIVVAVLVVAGVVSAVVTVLAWLKVFVAILGARIKQHADRDQAPALTTPHG
jgi:hypothetical protein